MTTFKRKITKRKINKIANKTDVEKFRIQEIEYLHRFNINCRISFD